MYFVLFSFVFFSYIIFKMIECHHGARSFYLVSAMGWTQFFFFFFFYLCLSCVDNILKPEYSVAPVPCPRYIVIGEPIRAVTQELVGLWWLNVFIICYFSRTKYWNFGFCFSSLKRVKIHKMCYIQPQFSLIFSNWLNAFLSWIYS